ncbi:hypothetical protein D3C76_1761110 [compost metagenome]
MGIERPGGEVFRLHFQLDFFLPAAQSLLAHGLQQGTGNALAAGDFAHAQSIQVKPVIPLATLADHEQPVAQRTPQPAELTHEGRGAR